MRLSAGPLRECLEVLGLWIANEGRGLRQRAWLGQRLARSVWCIVQTVEVTISVSMTRYESFVGGVMKIFGFFAGAVVALIG